MGRVGGGLAPLVQRVWPMGRLTSDAVITDCARCPVGCASRVEQGYRCPMSPKTRAGRHVLYVAGEAAKAVWFVKRGAVLLSEPSAHARDRITAVRGCGQLVGVEALVRGRYQHSARTVQGSTLCGAPIEAFSRWLDEPGAARSTLMLVLLAQESEEKSSMREGSVQARTARWALREDGPPGPLQRQHVAQLLGMSPETFSRALARLASLGALHVTRTEVRVLSPRLLEKLAFDERESPAP